MLFRPGHVLWDERPGSPCRSDPANRKLAEVKMLWQGDDFKAALVCIEPSRESEPLRWFTSRGRMIR